MCWIDYKLFVFHEVAKEDITCYKIFKPQKIHYRKKYLFFGKRKISSLYSLIENFRYVPYQKQDHIDLHVVKRSMLWSPTFESYYAIEEGYHSYATLHRANYKKEMLTPSVIVKCIIPKDTEYYINGDDEIVSTTIIVTDKLLE